MKFRRKSEKPDPAAAEPGDVGRVGRRGRGRPVDAEGPFDIDELPDDGVQRVDLGSLLIAPGGGPRAAAPGRREHPGRPGGAARRAGRRPRAACLRGPAPRRPVDARCGRSWPRTWPAAVGPPPSAKGRFGTELVCQLSVQTAEGRAANQASRIIGINGPRWMLRGTFLGRPATDPDSAAAWEDTLTKVVIRRGDHAMPVGDPLPVVLPDSARRTTAPTSPRLWQ